MKKTISILLGIAICLGIGFISRLLHQEAMEVWYPFLDKSPLNPPDIVFPIVWGVLYVLLGISLGLLYNEKNMPARKALLWLFAIQLLLNIFWNYSFFYLQSPMFGLINLLLLVALAVIFFIDTVKEKRSIAFFFLPYMVWMCFATYLNLHIAIYN